MHFSITPHGEIIDFYITSGHVADNNHDVIKRITKNLNGKIYGDKGYILGKSMTEYLLNNGLQMITKLRSNMKNKLLSLEDKLLLNKRRIIESVIAVLKEDLSIEHTRHRSYLNFFAHICSTLIAYAFRENKPSITSYFAQIA